MNIRKEIINFSYDRFEVFSDLIEVLDLPTHDHEGSEECFIDNESILSYCDNKKIVAYYKQEQEYTTNYFVELENSTIIKFEYKSCVIVKELPKGTTKQGSACFVGFYYEYSDEPTLFVGAVELKNTDGEFETRFQDNGLVFEGYYETFENAKNNSKGIKIELVEILYDDIEFLS